MNLFESASEDLAGVQKHETDKDHFLEMLLDENILEEEAHFLANQAEGLDEEPDVEAFALQDEELEKLIQDDPVNLLNDPRLVTEIGEDPIRLYLKEIGS